MEYGVYADGKGDQRRAENMNTAECKINIIIRKIFMTDDFSRLLVLNWKHGRRGWQGLKTSVEG